MIREYKKVCTMLENKRWNFLFCGNVGSLRSWPVGLVFQDCTFECKFLLVAGALVSTLRT